MQNIQTMDPIRNKRRNDYFQKWRYLGGVFTDWKWFKTENEGDKHCTFELHGSVTFGSNGEKKEGIFLCEDNRKKFTMVKQLA